MKPGTPVRVTSAFAHLAEPGTVVAIDERDGAMISGGLRMVITPGLPKLLIPRTRPEVRPMPSWWLYLTELEIRQ